MLSSLVINTVLALLAVAIHELGHMTVAFGCGMEVKGLQLSGRHGVATRIRVSADPVQNALTYFGGPLFNILALAFLPLGHVWILLNLLAGLGNLLPIPHSDGSQIIAWLTYTTKEKPKCFIRP